MNDDPNVLPDDLPVPIDDGAADHLAGLVLPDIALDCTFGNAVRLARLSGRTVVYAYPKTGLPGRPLPTSDWNLIPGARGCTPQSCGFRDHFRELRQAHVSQVFGLSTQDTLYQREVANRLHLPFALLSDVALNLTRALRLPTFTRDGEVFLRRLTMIVRDGRVEHVMYPVFPPDRDAAKVLEWLRANPARQLRD
jgi:peroxiredoxin